MDSSLNLIASFMKVLSDPKKLKILYTLKKEKKKTKALMNLLNLSQPYTSQLLKSLEKNDFISSRKDKGSKLYYIDDGGILELLDYIKEYVLQKQLEKIKNMEDL